jgi:hypothetical protein
VLAYLRDGVLALGCERDVRLLKRLKREFDFYRIDLILERTFVLCVGGWLPFYTLSSMETYDVEQEKWQTPVRIPRGRYGFGPCVIAGYMYITGGLYDGNVDRNTSKVERLNLSSNIWGSVAAMPRARAKHRACEVGGANGEPSSMYVVGGNSKKTWKYDAENDKWSDVAPLPAERLESATCSIGSDMYVIGGEHARVAQSSVYKYNSVSNTWSNVSPMPTARYFHGACVVGGMIYVTGGHDTDGTPLRSALCYDPSSDTWSQVASMSQARNGLGAFALDGCVYSAGGHVNDYDEGHLSTVEKYEPALDRWSDVPSMTVPRLDFHALVWKVEENKLDVMIRQALQSA